VLIEVDFLAVPGAEALAVRVRERTEKT